MCESNADRLNRDCLTVSIDRDLLDAETRRLLGDDAAAFEPWASSSLFAAVPVFISGEDLQRMREAIRAIVALSEQEAYRSVVLGRAPAVAQVPKSSRGVFFGYDFHLGKDGPKLIEVNTNAGGAMLNLLLLRSQHPGLAALGSQVLPATETSGLEARFVAMFHEEFRLHHGRDARLRTIAIVDDSPEDQFLYREFLLFRQLFRRAGLRAIIASPEQLRYEEGHLRVGDEDIDLVYNRLVDFYFEEPRNLALRKAYLDGRVVVTPHPRAHALFADKRNLIAMRDPALLQQAGLREELQSVLLTSVPETRVVSPEDATTLWSERKSWFFKPNQGYGSKAAYRGDKLTRGTFASILQRDYIAQRLVPPSERHVEVAGVVTPLKLDVRAFVYNDEVELWAVRLYSGQTTNFRTLGGGFAPVYTEVPARP